MKSLTWSKISLVGFSLACLILSCTPPSPQYEIIKHHLESSNIEMVSNFQYATILQSNSDFYEVAEVHNVGFELWFSNSDTIPCKMNIYISQPFDTIPFDDNFIRNNLTQIYNGSLVPAGQQAFTPWVTSMPRVANHQKFFSHLVDGQYNLYFVPEPPDAGIILDSANLIISASASRFIY